VLIARPLGDPDAICARLVDRGGEVVIPMRTGPTGSAKDAFEIPSATSGS
jgi:hypothetical protein